MLTYRQNGEKERKAMQTKPKIIEYMTMRNKDVPCQNCQFRKELYTQPPKDCKECGWFSRRNEPYTFEMPIYEEDNKCTGQEEVLI